MGNGVVQPTSVLLDTHVVLWSLYAQARLSEPAIALLEAADELLVSVASVYEIGNKKRLLRQEPDPILDLTPANLAAGLERAGFILLPLTAATMERAARLPFPHRDPFDHMLVAQALELGVPLISMDRALREQAADTPVIW